MKWKLLAIIVTISIVLAACGNSSEVKDEETLSNESTDVQESSQEGTNESGDSMETSEDATESEEEGELEVSLLDRALLRSVILEFPESSEIHYKGTSTSEEDGQTVTEATTMVMYTRGRDTRQENTDEDGTDIDIYLYEEGINYDYTLGETEGYIYYDDEDDRAYQEAQLAYEGQSLMTYIESEMNLEENVTLKAWRDKVAGRKAICIEMTEISEDDEGNDIESTMTIWFDAEYYVFLKFDMTFWGTRSVTEAVQADFNKKMNDKLFMPPSNVTFTE